MPRHAGWRDALRAQASQRGNPGGVGRAQIRELEACRARIAADQLLQLTDGVALEATVDANAPRGSLCEECDGEQANSIAFLQIADETFDVGVDTRSSVNEADYQVPFPFNGEIGKLTVTVGPSQLMPAEQARATDAAAKAND